MRNEPVRVPDSEGASSCPVIRTGSSGKSSPGCGSEKSEEDVPDRGVGLGIPETRRQKNLYQDKFILMSESLYSGVSHESVGLSEAAWNGPC